MPKHLLPASWRNLWPMPAPTVLVSCVGADARPNAITLAAAGVACATPPLLSVAISPKRHSHRLIRETGDFVVNVPSADQAELADRCGTVSGRDCDKFARLGITPAPAKAVRSPLIAECPVNYECTVFRVVPCGSHDLFLGEVKAVHVNAELLNPSGDGLDPARFEALLSLQTAYFAVGRRIGDWFFSRV